MLTKQEAITVCKSFRNVYEDYPFDDNWAVLRHIDNNKSFAFIFNHNGQIWINVKAEPMSAEFWRQIYPSVVPAYHMNKKHWIGIILDGSMADDEIKNLIFESYNLTLPPKLKNKLKNS